MKNLNNSLYHYVLGILLLTFTSCRKLIDVPAPPTSLSSENVYNNDLGATAVLNGLYAQLSENLSDGGLLSSTSMLCGLSADEFNASTSFSSDGILQYYQNSLIANSAPITSFWYSSYSSLFICNSAIEGINKSNSLTPLVKQQLLGEAKFMRAIHYFYLVNLFGDVPLVLSTDYKVNANLSRSPKIAVYQQIIEDLLDAKTLLSTNYLAGDLKTNSTDRARPNKWAATALLARVYLYEGNLGDGTAWEKAENLSNEIISNNSLYDVASVALKDVFSKNSRETLWALSPTSTAEYNTRDGVKFIIPSTGVSFDNPVYLTNSLVSSFEQGDLRKINWVGKFTDPETNIDYFYPYKYKINGLNSSVTEYNIVLRVAEQYLIRSEARAQLGNISGAQSDLNVIRTRAGLANSSANTQTSLLAAILKERRTELFTEWGHRWLDIKRTGNVDKIMSIAATDKGITWSPYKSLYPLPQDDINRDHNLVQNTGY